MSLYDEKRNRRDRRIANQGVPWGRRERRAYIDRRQMDIAEITLHEWALYWLKFREHAMALERAARRAKTPGTCGKAG